MKPQYVWTDGNGIYMQYTADKKPEPIIRELMLASKIQVATFEREKAVMRQTAKTWSKDRGQEALWFVWSEDIPVQQFDIQYVRLHSDFLSASNKRSVAQALQRNGLQVSKIEKECDTPRKQGRRFICFCFQLQCVAIVRRLSLNGKHLIRAEQQVRLDMKDPFIRRLMRIAVRASYSAGLGAAEVQLLVLESGEIEIEALDIPGERISDDTAQAYANAILDYVQHWRAEQLREAPAMLGMDPEFILYDEDQDKVIPASRYLPKEGLAGCDAIWIRDESFAESETMGRGPRRVIFPLVELRPAPSLEPKQLVIHLRQAMMVAERTIGQPGLQWLAGGMPKPGFAIGGHIHFSGLWLNTEFLRVLDNYMALPLAIIEARTSALRRPKYGFLGDFREQPHGGFEYRTLPSWIISPVITKGVIALAQLLSLRYRQLKYRFTYDESIQDAFYQGESKLLIPCFRLIEEELRQLDIYPQYAPYIDPLLQRIQEQRCWDERVDIRRLWKIGPHS